MFFPLIIFLVRFLFLLVVGLVFIIESFISFLSNGTNGVKYLKPNDLVVIKLYNIYIPPDIIPYIPKRLARINRSILYPLKAFPSSTDENINPAIDDIAITIIIIGDTIPALTAASPNINPPNIDMADPLVDDILRSDSFNISKHIIIKSASIYAGKGTKLRPAFNIINKSNDKKS